MSLSVLEVLHKGTKYLKSCDLVKEEASASSEQLLSYILHKSRPLLYLESNQSISDRQTKQFFELLRQRAGHYPVQYLTRETGFRYLNLEIRPGTLIPRPETEILVDVVLKRMPKTKNPSILDIGTGSGNIAISLAKENSQVKIAATDLSARSIQLARKNAKRNGVFNRILFVRTNLWKGIRRKFDVLVSNPPYLSDQDFKNLQPEVRFEPRQALSGGSDGLGVYRSVICSAKSILKPESLIAFEVGINQSKHVVQLLKLNQFHKIEITKDLAGIDRIVSAIARGRS